MSPDARARQQISGWGVGRRRRQRQILLIATLALLGPGVASAEMGWTINELAPGVFAALQPHDQRFDDSNSLVVIGDSGVLVVDAQTDASRVRELIEEIRRRTDRPVRFVVNTHWHGDHTQGNAVYREAFGAEVVFIAHRSLSEDVPERAAPYVTGRVARLEEALPRAEAQLASGHKSDGEAMSAEEKEQQQAAIQRAHQWLELHRDARFLTPTLTYERTLTLHLGQRAVQLLHLPGHTRGDSVVYLPDDKILATGDLLDDLPYAGHGYPRQWIAALLALKELDVSTLVPGHGPVFRGPEKLDRTLAFFQGLVGQVGAAVATGADLEATREAVDVAGLRATLAGDDEGAQKFFDAVIDEAIERTYLEARGELPERNSP